MSTTANGKNVRTDFMPLYLHGIYRKDEEKGVRRLKETYAAECKRVRGTMGWRDFNVGNSSAMETGDLGVVEVKMKLVEEQDAVKMDKDEERQDNFVCRILRLPLFLGQ